MKLMEKCPVCGNLAAVEKNKSNDHQRAFQCERGHVFRKMRRDTRATPASGVLNSMPNWTEIFNDCRRTVP